MSTSTTLPKINHSRKYCCQLTTKIKRSRDIIQSKGSRCRFLERNKDSFFLEFFHLLRNVEAYIVVFYKQIYFVDKDKNLKLLMSVAGPLLIICLYLSEKILFMFDKKTTLILNYMGLHF